MLSVIDEESKGGEEESKSEYVPRPVSHSEMRVFKAVDLEMKGSKTLVSGFLELAVHVSEGIFASLSRGRLASPLLPNTKYRTMWVVPRKLFAPTRSGIHVAKIRSKYAGEFEYKMNTIAAAGRASSSVEKGCGPGIHFFVNMDGARDYAGVRSGQGGYRCIRDCERESESEPLLSVQEAAKRLGR